MFHVESLEAAVLLCLKPVRKDRKEATGRCDATDIMTPSTKKDVCVCMCADAHLQLTHGIEACVACGRRVRCVRCVVCVRSVVLGVCIV